MNFHSLEYLVFLPAVVALHFATPHRFRWLVLLTASYVFYAAWRVDFLWLLIISTLTDYWVGLRLEAAQTDRARKLILSASLAVNLGLLFVFKYAVALWDGIGHLATALLDADPAQFRHFDIILPLGISFYTFQTLSYTIDIYRRRIPAERHLGYFALYVAFFPQLLAGPIERASTLLRNLRARRRFDPAVIGPACFLITLGMAKKLVIADRLGQTFVSIVQNPLHFDSLLVLLTPPATVYRYYCDLSGYADIAIGSAMLFGIQLSPNFNRPFAASSTMRFWYSWHITVTAWFRDYLLRSLVKGGSIAASRPLALMITGLVIGLWHGPTLGWAIAGVSVGLLAIPESKWGRWRLRHGIRPHTAAQRFLWDWSGRLYVWGVVFFLIGMPLTWSNTEVLRHALAQIAAMQLPDTVTMGQDSKEIWRSVSRIALLVAALEIWQWQEARGWARQIAAALPLEARWLAATIFAIIVLVNANLSQDGFLYFKF